MPSNNKPGEHGTDEAAERTEDGLLSPSSQLGRLKQTGGTPESGQVDPPPGEAREEWIEPEEEGRPTSNDG